MNPKPKRKRSAWFAFYPDDYIGGTRSLPLAARGAYVELLAYQFLHGSIPDCDRTICRIIGAFPDEWAEVREAVMEKFSKTDSGEWKNDRMASERDEREGIRQKRIEAGKSGADGKWGKFANGKEMANGMANAIILPMASTSTSTSTSKTSSPAKSAPTIPTTKSTSAVGKPPSEKVGWNSESGWNGITEATRDRWRAAFPACDIDTELAKMTAWLHANPAKARKSNWERFAHGWLQKSQDSGGGMKSNQLQNGYGKPAIPPGHYRDMYGTIRKEPTEPVVEYFPDTEPSYDE